MAITNLTLQLEEEDSKQFEQFCQKEGLNANSAINMFVKRVIITGKMPFVPEETTNVEPPEEIEYTEESLWQARLEFLEKSRLQPHEIKPLTEEGKEIMRQAREAIRELQEEAVRNGTSGMTMDEINEEIALYRKEKREKRALLREIRATYPFEQQALLKDIERMLMPELEAEIEEYQQKQKGNSVNV
ncbi:MAG: hypothetical protein FWG68_01775 [Defluviitaleaceae bacterium]|nr:hypothetical protein [Defluviitaleaceae bacterium]